MKSLIMNAGIGKRMGELTKNKPKCLIEIDKGQTILGRQLEFLAKNGIDDIIMTTGYLEDKIKNYVSINFPSLNIKYVYNPKYSSTNCIYSLYLTEGLIDEDVIFMTGDLVFDEKILKDLLNSDHTDLVIVNSRVKPPEKDFKSRIVGNTITEIGTEIYGESCFLTFPIYKLSKNSFSSWMSEIKSFVKKGETNIQAEKAIKKIYDKINLTPFFLDNEFISEVDTREELKEIRDYLK